MKLNLPILDQEVEMTDGEVLISKTDLKGKIIEVNNSFVKISGFSREELIGKNHNLVRHPDVPPYVFGVLWTTIQNGKLWNGIVKNRCKDGRYYWVEANVTPQFDHEGKLIGYLSVRTKPTKEQIAYAKLFYKSHKDRKVGSSNLLEKILAMSLKSKLYVLFIIASIPSILIILIHIFNSFNELTIPLLIINVIMMFAGTPLIINAVMQNIKYLSDSMMLTQGDGNLKRRLELSQNDDEISQLGKIYNALILSFKSMVHEIKVDAKSVTQSSSEMLSLSKTMHNNIHHQVDETNAIVSAVQQFSKNIIEISSQTFESKEIALQSAKNAENSNEQVLKLIYEFQIIQKTIDSLSNSVQQFVGNADKINKMTSQVKDIADQTNLLALNASIESARAGEAGKSFSIVAEEVRKLAEKSARSAHSIDSVTVDISAQSQSLSTEIHQSIHYLNDVLASMNHLNYTLKTSADSAIQVKESIEHIATVTKEQASAGQLINSSILKINHLGNETQILIDNNLKHSEHLKHVANQLEHAIERFNT